MSRRMTNSPSIPPLHGLVGSAKCLKKASSERMRLSTVTDDPIKIAQQRGPPSHDIENSVIRTVAQGVDNVRTSLRKGYGNSELVEAIQGWVRSPAVTVGVSDSNTWAEL